MKAVQANPSVSDSGGLEPVGPTAVNVPEGAGVPDPPKIPDVPAAPEGSPAVPEGPVAPGSGGRLDQRPFRFFFASSCACRSSADAAPKSFNSARPAASKAFGISVSL